MSPHTSFFASYEATSPSLAALRDAPATLGEIRAICASTRTRAALLDLDMVAVGVVDEGGVATFTRGAR